MIRRYTIVLTPDPDVGGYTVTVPLLPGCVTEGDTVEEAIAYAREAIQGHIEVLAMTGQEVPEETSAPRLMTVEVSEPAVSAHAD